MKTITILLLLPAILFAQGTDSTAAELFYRAFWLENAAGEYAKAFTLYKTVVDRHSGAPEAARAALGMVRVSAAQGKDFASIVKLIETKFPKAKKEIASARRIAAARLRPFDPVIADTDSGVIKKIKACYSAFHTPQGCSMADRAFLVEAGPLAHPMLSAVLRSPRYGIVASVASILVRQKSAKAYTVLEQALTDKQVLFKTAIVMSMHDNTAIDSAGVTSALVKLYRVSSPSMKKDIVATMSALTGVEGETRRIAFGLLTEALSSSEESVRGAALEPDHSDYREWPDAYVHARLDRMEKNDSIFDSSAYVELLRLADRKGVYERALNIYKRQGLFTALTRQSSMSAKGAEIVARTVIDQCTKKTQTVVTFKVAAKAATWAPSAAYRMLDDAVERGDKVLAQWVYSGVPSTTRTSRAPPSRHTGSVFVVLGAQSTTPRDVRTYLGAHADKLFGKALNACYAEQPNKRDTGSYVASVVGLGPNGGKLLIDSIRANPKKPLPNVAFDSGTLRLLGPVRMAKVAQLARNDKDSDRFLSAGVVYTNDPVKSPNAGYEFFKVVVPKVSQRSVSYLAKAVGSSGANRALVAAKLIQSPSWDWKEPSGGAYLAWRTAWVKSACATPALLPVTLTLTADKRWRVAETALKVAAEQPKSDAALKALVRGLNAPTMRRPTYAPTLELRKYAQSALAERGAAGLDALVKNLKWDSIGAQERSYALMLLTGSKQKRHARFVRGKLETRKDKWAGAWDTYRTMAPRAAAELALKEAFGQGGTDYRLGALHTLAKTSDARRIEVFRRVLTEGDNSGVSLVVQTISDQYLIELGPEVLEKLRSPDAYIRQTATKAIERLKFYADARKTFTNPK